MSSSSGHNDFFWHGWGDTFLTENAKVAIIIGFHKVLFVLEARNVELEQTYPTLQKKELRRIE